MEFRSSAAKHSSIDSARFARNPLSSKRPFEETLCEAGGIKLSRAIMSLKKLLFFKKFRSGQFIAYLITHKMR
jgi:hypothetical protein